MRYMHRQRPDAILVLVIGCRCPPSLNMYALKFKFEIHWGNVEYLTGQTVLAQLPKWNFAERRERIEEENSRSATVMRYERNTRY